MCLEDLRLGRGRVLGNSINVTGSVDAALKANPSRVAVIVSSLMLMYWNTVTTSVTADEAFLCFGPTAAGRRDMAFGIGTSVFVLRIEDVGSAIMGPISASVFNSSGAASVTLTEVYTEVNAQPLDTYNK